VADLDSNQTLNSIEDAIEDIRQGQIVIVVDDEDRENEGDLIMAAEFATEESMAFFIRHTSGIICVPVTDGRADQLGLDLMVDKNTESMKTAFTVTVDAAKSVTTGVSAADRAVTIKTLSSSESNKDDFVKPGHIFPLRGRPGGVLKRAGHTEAAIDLTRLAGLNEVGVLAEITLEDGSMARLDDLIPFAKKHDLKIISIADLIKYRSKTEKLIEEIGSAVVPSGFGDFRAHAFKSTLDGIEHIAFVKGEVAGADDVLVRVHSECLTGDVFGSLRCDCGPQLEMSMIKIQEAGQGVIVYLRGHEGRGIGLGHKIRAYNLQDQGLDTVDANTELGLPVDTREYGIGAQILTALGISSMTLLTNNPAKYVGLEGFGLTISNRVGLKSEPNEHNIRYLKTKQNRLGHDLNIVAGD